jgi:hypothetical protein
VDGFINRVDKIKEKISELEDRKTEFSQYNQQEEHRWKREMSYGIEIKDICVIGVLKVEDKENGDEISTQRNRS